MRSGLVYAILLASVVATVLSAVILFRMVQPPDASSAVLAGLWVAMPFLAAVGLALALRSRRVPLIVLLITVLIAGPIGVFLLNGSATQQAIAQQEARDAVQPGEDPQHGPGGMRKAGADAGVAITNAFSILLVLVLPPVQLVAIGIPTIIASIGTSVAARRNPQPIASGP